MRHLNTGEMKLFNVAEDMGETGISPSHAR